MEELRGQAHANMLRVGGRQDMQAAVREVGGPESPDSRLHLELTGKDPGAAMNGVAYQKGAALLQTVESIVGRTRLDAFLRDYFDRFAFQPMSSTRLVPFMNEILLQPGEADRIGIQKWIFEPGVPANAPPVQSEALAAVDAQVATWKNGGATSALQTTNWSTQEWLHFLGRCPNGPQPAPGRIGPCFRILTEWQQRDSVRVAEDCDSESLSAGVSCAREVPALAGAAQFIAPRTRVWRRRTEVGRWRSTSTRARVPPTISSRRMPSTRR